ELRGLLGAHVAAGLHGERAPLLGRRIVEEGIRPRAQDLLRERRRRGQVSADDLDLAGLDAREEPLEPLDIRRDVETVLKRLLDERMVRNLAITGRKVLRARELVGEDRREQILGIGPLE